MKDKEKIDVLIEKLHLYKPQLHNSDEFTRQIMEKIAIVERKQVPRFLSYIQIFSGTAAVLLMAFFVFQSNQYEGKNTKTTFPQPAYTTQIAANCSENFGNEKFTSKDIYLCYLQHKSEKNEQSRNLRKLLPL